MHRAKPCVHPRQRGVVDNVCARDVVLWMGQPRFDERFDGGGCDVDCVVIDFDVERVGIKARPDVVEIEFVVAWGEGGAADVVGRGGEDAFEGCKVAGVGRVGDEDDLVQKPAVGFEVLLCALARCSEQGRERGGGYF